MHSSLQMSSHATEQHIGSTKLKHTISLQSPTVCDGAGGAAPGALRLTDQHSIAHCLSQPLAQQKPSFAHTHDSQSHPRWAQPFSHDTG